MKKALLFVLALIAVGCADTEQSETASEGSEQVTPSASCADRESWFPFDPLEDLRNCAEQGDVDAQFALGIKYDLGETVGVTTGVPEDKVLAYMWYDLAAAQGGEGGEIAQGFKDILEERMSRTQINEAQRMSREWLEAHPSGN
jgi:hypothetical protein